MNELPMNARQTRPRTIETFLLDGRQLRTRIEHHFLNVIKQSPDREIKVLTLTQALLVLLIFRTGNATLTELADRMGTSAPTVSVLVDRLHSLGLIVRENQLSDRRKIRLRIHAKAVEKISRLDTSLKKKLSGLVEKKGENTFWAAYKTLLESFSIGC